jgi:DNA-binding transcriptional LysR family regulator
MGSLSHLAYFAAVLETGFVSTAAERPGITKDVVSP